MNQTKSFRVDFGPFLREALPMSVTPFFTLHITPTPADIDELGHVNNAVWVRWIQDVATAHWNAVAAPEHVEAYVWVVVRHEIDYLGNVTLSETVTARTWISGPPKGARFDRNVEFLSGAGKIVVRAKTTWALIDRTTGRIARVPAEVATRFLG
jgi:acyl-CoA thioester hydrolase